MKLVCGNCTEFVVRADGKAYCDIRYVVKNGVRTNLPLTKNKKACQVFLPTDEYSIK